MKPLFSMIAGTALALVLGASAVAKERFNVLAIGKVGPESKDTLLATFNRAFLGLQPGEGLVVYDAINRSVVGKIDVPNEPRFSLAASRQKHFARVYATIRQFLEKGTADGTVLVPELLAELAKHVKTEAGQRTLNLLMVADALHHDSREPAFSMRGGTFPSDGYLVGNERLSPFGTANRRGLLSNTDVYFCHVDAREHWGTTLHAERVERAWALYAAELGATIATFTHDLNRCTAAFLDGKSNPPRTFELDRTAKPQMLRTPARVADLGTGDAVSAKVGDEASDAFLKDGAQLSRRPPPSQECRATKVGIRWASNVDIDIYARNERSNPYLFFGNVTSPEGRYNFDWQVSPDKDGAIEFIEFTKPLNLRQAEVWLNFYDGSAATPPSGQLRVFCDGKVFQGAFKFEVTSGNKAAGLNPAGGMRGQHWLKVDLAKLVGLPEQRVAR